MTKPQPVPASPSIPLLAALFMGSGFSALAYQVILSRYAQLIVGGTAFAISALLVAFMLGMSLGSALGGRWADRTDHPLRLYAVAEGAIGLYCVAFPFLFPQFTSLYLAVVPPIGEGAVLSRNLVRFALGVGAFVLPTFFMGITTPAFARAVASKREDSGAWLARLYGWNTLGAALGALVTAYALVPTFGLVGSMAIATLINFSIAVIAWRRSSPVPAFSDGTPADEGVDPAPAPRAGGVPVLWVFLAASLASGFLSFALEIIWTHVLAILLGNSVYAFGLMLGSLLLGLALGSVIARRLMEPSQRARSWLGASLALAGLFVLLTLPVWDRIPSIFLLLSRASPSFALLEGVRFLVAFTLMLLPTAAFGITFPLTLHCVTAQGKGFGEHVGKVYAVNTIGAVLGALSGPYLFLPRLGSLDSLKVLGTLLLVCGGLLILGLASFPRRRLLAGAAISSVLWVPVLPIAWDFNALNVAAAVYLGDSASGGEIIYKREDATGGLTSVVKDREVLTLLTNGKFQGDNSEEIPIQHRLANIPTLFTPARERALVIGLGTGVTLAALSAHGFKDMVCAELSEPIIEAATEHFADVNGGITRARNVRMVREDGRSVLLESPDRYDVISVEVTTIWFAGAGSIYSREFYRLASERLRRDGVLLQWFPIHHLSARNLFVVVNTVRSVFPHVSLWTHRHQAFVVASNQPLQLDLDSIRADQKLDGMRPYLSELPSGSPLELLSDLVVTDRDMDRFLNSMGELLRAKRTVVSTDAWPTLEYETPKDLLDNFSYFQNRATFRRFRSAAPFPFRGAPTQREESLGQAAFARGWNDPRALARLSGLWKQEPELSDTASQWLFDELTGEEALGTDLGSDPAEDLRDQAETLGTLVGRVGAERSCSPTPRFFSNAVTVPLKIVGHSGVSLDGTRPEQAVDGTLDPALTPGWRVRPDGRPVHLDVDFDTPRDVATISMVVQPIDGAIARTRVFGRDEQGRWHPLVSGSQEADIVCAGQRTYRLTGSHGRVTGLRVIVQGEGNSFRIALYELWVEAKP